MKNKLVECLTCGLGHKYTDRLVGGKKYKFCPNCFSTSYDVTGSETDPNMLIIAVDFDGTLHDGEYPEIGNPVIGAVEAMQSLRENGHYLILWTCRNGKLLEDAQNWLLQHNITIDNINEQNPENAAQYGDDTRKVYADVYVDDRQVGGLPSWFAILEYINTLKK